MRSPYLRTRAKRMRWPSCSASPAPSTPKRNGRPGGIKPKRHAVRGALGETRGRLLAYSGPRKSGFRQNFLADAGSLRTNLLAQESAVGDFEFARTNVGTSFEAFMVVGNGLYLICKNTVQSMNTIAKDPLCLNAQVPFVELSEQFAASPIDLSGLPAADFAVVA